MDDVRAQMTGFEDKQVKIVVVDACATWDKSSGQQGEPTLFKKKIKNYSISLV